MHLCRGCHCEGVACHSASAGPSGGTSACTRIACNISSPVIEIAHTWVVPTTKHHTYPHAWGGTYYHKHLCNTRIRLHPNNHNSPDTLFSYPKCLMLLLRFLLPEPQYGSCISTFFKFPAWVSFQTSLNSASHRFRIFYETLRKRRLHFVRYLFHSIFWQTNGTKRAENVGPCYTMLGRDWCQIGAKMGEASLREPCKQG